MKTFTNTFLNLYNNHVSSFMQFQSHLVFERLLKLNDNYNNLNFMTIDVISNGTQIT
jgi:hypothetical protein